MKHYYYWYNEITFRLVEFVCRDIPKADMPCTQDTVSACGKRIWWFGYHDRQDMHENKKKIVKILR